MTKRRFKIFLMNVQYFNGMDGNVLDYILKFNRYFFVSKKIQNNVLRKLYDLIYLEKPDLICLIEVKDNNHLLNLLNDEYYYFDIENKYGENSFLKKTPFFRKNSNAILSKDRLSFEKKYLVNGTKKLVYEIKIPKGPTVFLTHFSLDKKVRKKQFKEIKKMTSSIDSKIICGDFNLFKGVSELNELILDTDLSVTNTVCTYPSHKPIKCFDTFVVSSDLNVKTKVLNEVLSDHLPVILEIEF